MQELKTPHENAAKIANASAPARTNPDHVRCPVCGESLDLRAVDSCSKCRYTVPPVNGAEPVWRESVRGARRLFYGGAGVLAASIVLFAMAGIRSYLAAFGMFGLMISGGLFAVTFVRGLESLGRMAFAREPIGWKEWLLVLGAGLMSAVGMFFTAIAVFGTARGRQLRKNGKVLLPPLAPGGSWGSLDLRVVIPAALRDALAARWRENARTEHASVAAFARLTLDLMALGAPPELIASANRDSLDEIRHTELCFSLAKAIDGRDIGPGPFPEAQEARTLPANRTLALCKLAVDSLIDGALHEGLSARILARLARRCEVPAARSLISELARDEGRHCSHGWDAVEWCLVQGGPRVAQVLRGAAAALPERPGTDLPLEAQDGTWEAYGIHGLSLEEEQYRLCRAAVIARVEAMTGVPGGAPRGELAAA